MKQCRADGEPLTQAQANTLARLEQDGYHALSARVFVPADVVCAVRKRRGWDVMWIGPDGEADYKGRALTKPE